MKRRVGWSEVYENCQSLYPNLTRKALGYRPYDYMSILIYFPDGLRMIYSEVERRARFITA